MWTNKSCALKFFLVVSILLTSSAKLSGQHEPLRQLPELQGRHPAGPRSDCQRRRHLLRLFNPSWYRGQMLKDVITWRLCGDVFAHLPAWAVQDVSGVRGLWAPDVSYFNGKYHLYYSVSTFGSNRSSIGLATNQTLDPTSDKYRWQDRGKVIGSCPTDDWNAIDPNIVLDEDGQPWLSFGSFWSGIKLRRIDPATGKLSHKDEELYSLASRPRDKDIAGAIEAPFIIRKNNYYYLFVSFDFCCRGADSTYNIRVGRSKRLTGPYIDRSGKPMIEGGGTIVITGGSRWRGPGHCAILQDKDGDKIVYHAYDASARGASTLRIASLMWDPEGWPTISSANEP